MCVCVCVQCSLQRPEYQHFREKFGCARTIDAFEEISAELKALVMVSGKVMCVCVRACVCVCACTCVICKCTCI